MKKILDLNKKAWNNLAKTYNDRQISPISNIFKGFIGYLPPKGRILDLGCGTGIPYTMYMVNKGFRVIGIDFSEEMIKAAARNVPEARFLRMSMTEIPFNDEFDGVISSFSMLLLSPEMFLETAKRIYTALLEGGLFYLSLNEPPNRFDDPDEDAYVNVMGQDMYSRAYTFEEVEAVFTGLGFDQVSFNREVQYSKEFGEEHIIEFIYRKRSLSTFSNR